MARLLFTISKGMNDVTLAARAFHFAKVAREKGHEVTLFLLEDGVIWAVWGMAQDLKTLTGEDLRELIDYLSQNGARIYVCKACADKRFLDPEDFVEGAELKGAPEYIDLVVEHDQVLIF